MLTDPILPSILMRSRVPLPALILVLSITALLSVLVFLLLSVHSTFHTRGYIDSANIVQHEKLIQHLRVWTNDATKAKRDIFILFRMTVEKSIS